MNKLSQNLRKQALELTLAEAGAAAAANPHVASLIDVWLASVEEEDITGMTPKGLASVLWDGFSSVAAISHTGCHIRQLHYVDGRGGTASALLILNPDMPFLVDSFVMAMRRLRIASRAVLNAVLSVRRDSEGGLMHVERAKTGSDPLESYVLCLLAEEISQQEMDTLLSNVSMVANDAAVVRRDSVAISTKMQEVALAKSGDEAQDVAAFIDWARNGGFEPFGYAYYRVVPGSEKLVREAQSCIGLLGEAGHAVYENCLAGIPEDLATLAERSNHLSVV